MKLLVVGLNYAPEPVGIGPYTTGLAESFAARGHEVTVVAGKPYYPQWRPYEGEPRGTSTRQENGVTVTRVPHYIPAEPNGPRRIAHQATFAASAYGPVMAAARAGPDLVFTIAPSLLAVPVAARAARKAGAPLWLHVQDFEVEAAFATGLLNGKSTFARAASNLEARILGTADVVSSISPQMCEKLVAKGIAADRVFELRNWSNAAFRFCDADDAAYRREWRLGDRHVALYSGNIGNKQGLEIILDAARLLSARKDIIFVICGEGPHRRSLEGRARGLDNVQFHDLQLAERMADLLSLASVHLLPQIIGAADLVLPSKLTNILASGRPVVATAAPGTGLHAEVEGCGINTAPGDAQAMADAIAMLVDDPARREALGRAAQERAAERWSRDAIIARLEEQAEKLLEKTRPR